MKNIKGLRAITFSKQMILANHENKSFHFMPNIPYEVVMIKVEYGINQFSFVCDDDLFEFVPLDDTKIELTSQS